MFSKPTWECTLPHHSLGFLFFFSFVRVLIRDGIGLGSGMHFTSGVTQNRATETHFDYLPTWDISTWDNFAFLGILRRRFCGNLELKRHLFPLFTLVYH
jgi:hypothetical protein